MYLINSNSSDSRPGSGNRVLTVLSTKDLYSVLSLIFSASKIQAKACTWGLSLSWNSMRNA